MREAGWSLRAKGVAWTDRNVAALRDNAALLTPQNRAAPHAFCRLRNAPFVGKCALGRRMGIYRQTSRGQLSLIIGLLLRRM